MPRSHPLPSHLPDELQTGIVEIDAQHHHLFLRVGQLEHAARGGRLWHATGMLDYLERYAATHFVAEERHMVDSGYPGLAEHRIAHQTFAAELRARRLEFGATGSSASLMLGLCDWMADWLTVHVRESDGAMATHLRRVRP